MIGKKALRKRKLKTIYKIEFLETKRMHEAMENIKYY